MNAINLQQKLKKFSDHWHPRQIAGIDDMQVLLAKVKGEFVWHKHEKEDELFQVVKGTLFIQFRDRTEEVKQGEIIVVPKGVEHCPMTKDGEEVHIMLFEKLSVKHTGEVTDEKTRTTYPKI
ncbi:cupin domain-containing protein [Antarcticibacterium flavum]|uniref:Cupin domain-containing protein n=1 Tax=Antarcticibacterium flavum TaxID=2058175 RepID=A0A5B7X1Z7_9FLAO|nr:cupin domain-containing protein [Antarcticibacterium flavum]MCM4161142.1 cupin domain-containing protein [Antarcticibacterium sp. W02-3]QCY69359.1 cupin domain-containing protein [Antarcticibacterium flavum]